MLSSDWPAVADARHVVIISQAVFLNPGRPLCLSETTFRVQGVVMGKRGPLGKQKPVYGQAYLTARAEAAAERGRLNADELLAMPSGLSSGAASRWVTLAPLLLEDGRLKPDTRESLVIYCRLADQLEQLSSELLEQGAVLTGPHGRYSNPLFKIVQGIRSQLLRYSAALGLDPAGRARLESCGHLEQHRDETDEDRRFNEIIYGHE